ncbi:MAG: hypothetical protein GY849_12725, partial [Deltaproteobacteria bacterium]|nr:hypothetical protein [Deltaproteobacteria bacterium]
MGLHKRQVDREPNDSRPGSMHSRGKPEGSSFHIREVLLLFFLVFLVFLIYSNTLGSPFILDDRPNIVKNPHIRLTRINLGDIKRAGFDGPMKNRPVSYISYGLNYYFHQYHVFGFHLANILIHVTTGIFLYLFIKATLNLKTLRSRYGPYGWIPFIAVLVWLIHPIQTQSVTYIVQRMNSMASMFYVLAFFLYVRARLADENWKKWALFAASAASGLCSFGSKEIAATLPFCIFLYEWYFFQDLSWTWLKGRLFLFVGVLLLFVVAAFIYLGANPVEKILSSYAMRDFTLTQRVLTEFRVVIFYIGLLLFPHPSRLNLDR